MRLIDKDKYPKEIVINLEKYKQDEESNTKVFVAHDYIEIEKNILIEDKDENGYWINAHLQIPINIMAKLLKKLNTSPFLIDRRHYNRNSYLYKDEVVQFEEWHLEKGKKARKEYLVREQGSTKWISIPKKKWSSEKLKILKKLK